MRLVERAAQQPRDHDSGTLGPATRWARLHARPGPWRPCDPSEPSYLGGASDPGEPLATRATLAPPLPSRRRYLGGLGYPGEVRMRSRAGARRGPGWARAAVRSSRACRVWALTTASQYGQAAAIPPARGRYSGFCVRGFTHTILCATRDRRSISRPRISGSPVSQPSEMMTTTAPRAMPRRP